MNVIVQSKTLEITGALREFVTRQTQKIAERGQKISTITVFLESIQRKKNEGNAKSAKFLVSMPGRNVVVQEKAKDLYFAVSQAAHATMRQVRKMKERRAERGVMITQMRHAHG